MAADQKSKSKEEKHSHKPKHVTAGGLRVGSTSSSRTKPAASQDVPAGASRKRKPVGHKKVFDVVPPGKAPAATNSRSVVTDQKPPVPDDQFVKREKDIRGSEVPMSAGVNSVLPGSETHASVSTSAAAVAARSDSGNAKPTGAPELPVNGDGLTDGRQPSADSQVLISPRNVSAPLLPNDQAARSDDDSSSDSAMNVTAPRLSAPVIENLSPSELLADLAVEQVVQSDAIEELQHKVGESSRDGNKMGVSASGVLDRPWADRASAGLDGAADAAGLVDIGGAAGFTTSGASGGAANSADAAQLKPSSFRNGSDGRSDSSTSGSSPRSVDDLLADSSAPELPSPPVPSRFSMGKVSSSGSESSAEASSDTSLPKAIVSTHHHRRSRHRKRTSGLGRAILTFFTIILIAAITLNFLLDAEIIRTELNLPYTDLID